MSVHIKRPFNNSLNKKFLRPTLFVIGVIFFIALIIHSWPKTQLVLQTLNWPIFFLSILIAIIDNILFSFLFQQLLTKYDLCIDYLRVGKMFFYGQIAKYIPGRFWNILYHATFLQRPQAITAILFANLDLTAISMLRSLFIAIALILFQQNTFLAFLAITAGIVMFCFFFRSRWISHIFHLLFRKKSSPEQNTHNSTNVNNRLVLLLGVLSWGTYLLANFFFMHAAFKFTAEEAIPYIAYFGIAWVVGVLSFIVPAGIGIREITFIFLAQTFNKNQLISVELLTAIAVVYRFWQILLEFGSLGVGFTLDRIKKISRET